MDEREDATETGEKHRTIGVGDRQTPRRTHLPDCHISVSHLAVVVFQSFRDAPLRSLPSSEALTDFRQFGDLGGQGSESQIGARGI